MRESLRTMTVSLKGEYALAALLDLAIEQRGSAARTPIKIADIARRQKVPQKFLELILAGLKQGGFVESRRGADGGYLLAKPASSILVGDVLRFIEGAKSSKRGCETAFSALWGEVDRAVREVLDKASIEEIARQWQDRQQRYVPNWEI
jgi:Rrf2 family cysteine metabolism transcriptional repressor